MSILERQDPDVWQAVQGERRRQQQGLEMIASENYTSPAVMAAQGSCLTNKYAEGYPGRRYYGGCEFVDAAERLALDRVKQLFGADHANVQPHSGAQANMAVYMAALQPGDTILGLDLAHGGHLTHGMRLNFSGKYFKVASYGVRRDDHRIDFDHLAAQARQHKPKHVIAAKAVAFGEALRPSFRQYIAQVIANAKVLAEELQRAGFPVVSGGTDNHLMLVDVTAKGVTGKQAEHALDAAGIAVNKN